MTTYGYCRVSTAEQVNNGQGLEIQQNALRAAGCKEVFTDEGQSGSNGLDTRVMLAHAVEELKPGDTLLVYRLDRLARDLVLQETLIALIRKRGAQLASCDPGENDVLLRDDVDPSRVLIRQILGALAQYERALIRNRMLAGKLLKKARGKHVGGMVSYGWRATDDGSYVHHKVQWPILEEMRKRKERGFSFRDIAAYLEVRGIASPKGNDRWNASTVKRVLEWAPPDSAHASRTEE